ncbi:MAG: serine hydrolase, partial [Pseudomonadota bacterium]|nr:serine hydrolase [Pseudomonadota bacterium]
TIFRIASMTKPITAAAAMILVEEGRIALDDPVERWLPELADRRVLRSIDSALGDTVPARRSITLDDLLTFRLGLGAVMAPPGRYPIQSAMADLGVAPGPHLLPFDADEFMARIGRLPLIHQPGERWMYHTGAGRHYTVLSAGETPVGGLMELPQRARDAGARPGWIGYVAVDDVDAVALRVRDAGGAIHRAAEDIPGIGRFAIVDDPQGATFTLFKALDAGETPPAAGATPGHVGWHDLQAADWEAAFAFYADLFGWTKAEAIDMGPMGIYQLFATGGAPVGGMMTKTDAMPAPGWTYYFNVDDTDTAVIRVKDAGGQVLNGPQQVPGGQWVAQCLDPQGAVFGMVGPDR